MVKITFSFQKVNLEFLGLNKYKKKERKPKDSHKWVVETKNPKNLNNLLGLSSSYEEESHQMPIAIGTILHERIRAIK